MFFFFILAEEFDAKNHIARISGKNRKFWSSDSVVEKKSNTKSNTNKSNEKKSDTEKTEEDDDDDDEKLEDVKKLRKKQLL